jgi:hypothetical protein
MVRNVRLREPLREWETIENLKVRVPQAITDRAVFGNIIAPAKRTTNRMNKEVRHCIKQAVLKMQQVFFFFAIQNSLFIITLTFIYVVVFLIF